MSGISSFSKNPCALLIQNLVAVPKRMTGVPLGDLPGLSGITGYDAYREPLSRLRLADGEMRI
jgi:hypothetical protein